MVKETVFLPSTTDPRTERERGTSFDANLLLLFASCKVLRTLLGFLEGAGSRNLAPAFFLVSTMAIQQIMFEL
jgi:hypothetical protein